MSNLKCPKCNLVNFAGSTVCKRCQSSLSGISSQTSVNSTVAGQSTVATHSSSQKNSISPSFVNIVKNDYGALIGLLLPVVTWGIFIATNVFGFSFNRRGRNLPTDGNDSTFLYIAIVGTGLGIALLVWRVYCFQQVFNNGEIILGRITSISFFKDRGRIEYSYNINGQTHQSGNAIMKNQKTQTFRDGDEIELIVDRSNPSRAFIKILYLRLS